MSGTTDFLIANHLDPTQFLLNSVSGSIAASHVFAADTNLMRASVADYLIENAGTSDKVNGLIDWAAGGAHGGETFRQTGADLRGAIVDRLTSHPETLRPMQAALGIGDLPSLIKTMKAPQVGISLGLRPILHKQSTLEWLSSDEGQKVMTALARDNSLSSLRAKLGTEVPVKTLLNIAHARTAEEVAAAYADQLGLSITGPVKLSVIGDAIRPPETMRAIKIMPKGFLDTRDPDQVVDRPSRSCNWRKFPTISGTPCWNIFLARALTATW